MKDFIEVGSSPAEEDCVQVDPKADYLPAMRAELRRYKEMLERRFPNPPEGAYFSIRWNQHDFGSYGEVAVTFDDSNREAVDFAYVVEGHCPARWDDTGILQWRAVADSEAGLQREI